MNFYRICVSNDLDPLFCVIDVDLFLILKPIFRCSCVDQRRRRKRWIIATSSRTPPSCLVRRWWDLIVMIWSCVLSPGVLVLGCSFALSDCTWGIKASSLFFSVSLVIYNQTFKPTLFVDLQSSRIWFVWYQSWCWAFRHHS